jgi:hypothetical protein
MSDIGLIMNGVLGLLLIGALALGWRLEGRLKALRASHQSFSKAVEDLDRAAGRAEQGLADLRAATDEAADSLAGRIERAGHLAGKLEKLTVDAESAHTRLAAAPRIEAPRAEPRTLSVRPDVRPEPARAEPVRAAELLRPAQSREDVLARFSERYAAAARPTQQPLSAFAEAAARNDLILEDDVPVAPQRPERPSRLTPEAAARIERLKALTQPKQATAAITPIRRPVEEELFEAPRRAAGGFR